MELRTERPFQLVDITAIVAERVRRSGVVLGTASVQVLHTTAALFVNENEPRLLEDIEAFLRRLAPAGAALSARPARAAPGAGRRRRARRTATRTCRRCCCPRPCSLNVVGGELDLGRWQSLFLAELDGPRSRSLSIVVSGTGEVERARAAPPRARRAAARTL